MDELKIDQSFVKDLGAAADSVAVVGATITMAHSLGLTVVAEGVATSQQLRTLRQLGCDFVQGYVFSRPERPAALHGTLSRGRGLVDSMAWLDQVGSDDDAALSQIDRRHHRGRAQPSPVRPSTGQIVGRERRASRPAKIRG